jgi:hypothetical protein
VGVHRLRRAEAITAGAHVSRHSRWLRREECASAQRRCSETFASTRKLNGALTDEGVLTDQLTKVTVGGLELPGESKDTFTLLGDRTGDLRVGDKVVADIAPSNAPVPIVVTSKVKNLSFDSATKKTTVTLEDSGLTGSLQGRVHPAAIIRVDTPDFGDCFRTSLQHIPTD